MSIIVKENAEKRKIVREHDPEKPRKCT